MKWTILIQLVLTICNRKETGTNYSIVGSGWKITLMVSNIWIWSTRARYCLSIAQVQAVKHCVIQFKMHVEKWIPAMCNVGSYISNSLVLMIMWTRMRYFYISERHLMTLRAWKLALHFLPTGNRLPGLFHSRLRNLTLMTGLITHIVHFGSLRFLVLDGCRGHLVSGECG